MQNSSDKSETSVWTNLQETDTKFSVQDRFLFLLKSLYPNHMKRLEASKPNIKDSSKSFSHKEVMRMMNAISPGIPSRIGAMTAGILPLFIGLLVEEGRQIMLEQCISLKQPLQPRHIREAYRRLVEKHVIPDPMYERPAFISKLQYPNPKRKKTIP